MRRASVQLALHLIAGLSLTIALAWIAAVWLPIPAVADHAPAPLSRITGLLEGDHIVRCRIGFGRTEWQVLTPRGAWKQDAGVRRYGFPFRAFESQHIIDLETREATLRSAAKLEHVWRPYRPANRGFRNTLPLRPLWPGLLADTLFGAILTAALWRAGLAFLQWRTGNRDRCRHCRCARGGLPTCPACGHCKPEPVLMRTGAIAASVLRLSIVPPAAFALTLIVAWSCALLSPPKDKIALSPPSPGQPIGSAWAFDTWRAPVGRKMDEYLLHTGAGVRVETLDVTSFTCGPIQTIRVDPATGVVLMPPPTVATAPAPPRHMTRVRVGLPFSALECRPPRIAPPGAWPALLPARTTTDVWQEGLDLPFKIAPLTATVPRRLPIKPVWHGFILNLMFYTVILLLAHGGAKYFRRAHRRRRGRCTRCAYELRDLRICPECGLKSPA